MKTVGIICEYNPFHLGHKKQINTIRSRFGQDCAIVCLMSGNYVQRGAPSLFDKSLRAKAAVLAGADLVLELPVTYALSSAEGFAAGGVRILSGFCDYLCFGTESGTADSLTATAEALLSEAFSHALREKLDTGISFPAARQQGLAQLGCDTSLLERPNDILAVEYCKAIQTQNSSMVPLPILRGGNYHADTPDSENPSATAVRQLFLGAHDWKSCVPETLWPLYEGAPCHTLAAGERAVLARLRTMTEADFETLPYGSEGLWRKFMHACRGSATLEEILTATKSKRYTRTRLDRMLMCAFLGISREMMGSAPPYTRVLAFNDVGRLVLKQARLSGEFLHTGDRSESPYWSDEQRWEDLYGLFRLDAPAPAGDAAKRRVYIHK